MGSQLSKKDNHVRAEESVYCGDTSAVTSDTPSSQFDTPAVKGKSAGSSVTVEEVIDERVQMGSNMDELMGSAMDGPFVYQMYAPRAVRIMRDMSFEGFVKVRVYFVVSSERRLILNVVFPGFSTTTDGGIATVTLDQFPAQSCTVAVMGKSVGA